MLSSQGQSLEPDRELRNPADTTSAVGLLAGCWATNLTCSILESWVFPPLLTWDDIHNTWLNVSTTPGFLGFKRSHLVQDPSVLRSVQERRCHLKQLFSPTLPINGDPYSLKAEKDLAVSELKKPNSVLRWTLFFSTKLRSMGDETLLV